MPDSLPATSTLWPSVSWWMRRAGSTALRVKNVVGAVLQSPGSSCLQRVTADPTSTTVLTLLVPTRQGPCTAYYAASNQRWPHLSSGMGAEHTTAIYHGTEFVSK